MVAKDMSWFTVDAMNLVKKYSPKKLEDVLEIEVEILN